MSYNWMLVRGGSANPSSLKFTALMNKQNITENELFKPEDPQPRILSYNTEDLCLTQDPFSWKILKYINNFHYFGPFEPDGVHLKYWCRFNHIASKIADKSFSKNYTIPVGNPRLCEGPSDGVKGGTIVSRINTQDTLDYFYTVDDEDEAESDLTIANMGSGFSIYIEFMIEQIVGESTLRLKIDNAAGNDGHMITVGPNGELKFFVKRAGTMRNFISANNKITEGLYYAAALTYTASDNSMVMRINNQAQTDSANETPTFPTGHSTDMFHGIGTDQINNPMIGRLKDSRHYKDMIFSGSQMDNIWNNKRSISPIQYGHLAVASVAHFNTTTFTGGFDSTGYDTTGYETI
jgi:hypothetical protein